MLYTPKSEIEIRIKKLQAMLTKKKIEGALIIQAVDLFYFTGTAQNAHLYIPASGQPLLMVKKSMARAREESAIDNIIQLSSIKKVPEIITDAGNKMPETLGLEMDVIPAASYFFYQEMFPGSIMMDVSGLIRQVRQIKSQYEIDLLRISGRKMSEVFAAIPAMINQGMTEVELAAKIEGMARSMGHMGYINMRAFNNAPFFGQLMSGWSAAVPSAFDGATGGPGLTPIQPQSSGYKTIEKNEPILVDYTGLWDGYITDQTRFYSIGKVSDKLEKAFNTAIDIQKIILEGLKPGVYGIELNELALAMAEQAGLAENFMGYGREQAKFIGHGVGLELDELPVLAKGLNTVLEAGMVVAIEPKFVFPGEGVVGIENTFVINEKGAEKLTVTPDEFVIVDG
jgi:Xaa-Pro dipeptidase